MSMSVKWFFSLVFVLAFGSEASHAANRCAELLTNYHFSLDFTASAIEAKINFFKSESRDQAILHLIDYEVEINREFRRIMGDVLIAKRAYRQDFSFVARINPLNEERKLADGLLDRIDRHLGELAYYDRYVTDLVMKMTKGSSQELPLDKHRQLSEVDPENVTEVGITNALNPISPMNTSHEAIQTDFAADNSNSFSNPW